jgi:hypothetical protein
MGCAFQDVLIQIGQITPETFAGEAYRTAIAKDVAANGASWINVPAGYFFRLDGDSPNQYGRISIGGDRTLYVCLGI